MLKTYEKLCATKMVAKCVLCGRRLYTSQPMRRLDGKVVCVTHPVVVKKEE